MFVFPTYHNITKYCVGGFVEGFGETLTPPELIPHILATMSAVTGGCPQVTPRLAAHTKFD